MKMGQLSCVVNIAIISWLCCFFITSAMYIDKENNIDRSSNIMKVHSRNGKSADYRSPYEEALEQARTFLSESQYFKREKKQSQLTFIVKPDTPPSQSDVTSLLNNQNSSSGVIYIQVPAYVNHSYSLYVHQSQNNSHSNEKPQENQSHGSVLNEQESRPENTETVNHEREPSMPPGIQEDLENTQISGETNMQNSKEENANESQPELNQPLDDEDIPNEDSDDSTGQIEETEQEIMISQIQNSDLRESGEEYSENNQSSGDHEPENENESHTNSDEGTNANQNYEEIMQTGDENTGTYEEATESDDCDDDIDESQDIPDTSVELNQENVDEMNQAENDNDINENQQYQTDDRNSNEINDESQNESSVGPNESSTENTELNNQDWSSHEADQDHNGEASNLNENIGNDNQNDDHLIFANDNNDITENEDSSNSMNEQSNDKEYNSETAFHDDANTLDQNEQTTSAPNVEIHFVPLKESCLQPIGQFASPNSCQKYVNCWNSIPFEHDCPPGLYFNDAHGYCDWKHKVDCGKRPINSPLIQGCEGNTYGTFRNPKECSEYFVCINHEPVKFKCPEGLNYNDNIGVCDHQYRVDCGNSPSHQNSNTTAVEKKRVSPGLVSTDTYCKPDYLWRVGGSCRRVDICSNEGLIQQVRCPTLTAYDFKAKKCIYEGAANC